MLKFIENGGLRELSCGLLDAYVEQLRSLAEADEVFKRAGRDSHDGEAEHLRRVIDRARVVLNEA